MDHMSSDVSQRVAVLLLIPMPVSANVIPGKFQITIVAIPGGLDLDGSSPFYPFKIAQIVAYAYT